ncbi:unnamed protein product (mitochondrion) [Plasmodiophora brassicae]|uniref:RPA-interacting protein C-terminal domain-containing protein n=1 Tax=Plasmodiophora brassicae TaxID=37360 RepID=A0A3P3YJF2_PLABS|nr:unnamed protein product [Plasmodiophora brassicae]
MQQQQSPSGRVPLKAGRPLDEWRRRLRASCATRSRADRARFLRGLRSHPPDGSLSAAEIDQLIASLEFEFSQDVADQIHLAAYESSLPEIVGDFDYDLDHRGAYESILCPVCQRHHVAASAGTYSCPCGRFTLQVGDQVPPAMLRGLLARSLAAHPAPCRATFFVPTPRRLIIACSRCQTQDVVLETGPGLRNPMDCFL